LHIENIEDRLEEMERDEEKYFKVMEAGEQENNHLKAKLDEREKVI